MPAVEKISLPKILTRAEWARHKNSQGAEIPKSGLGKALEALEKVINSVNWDTFSDKNCAALAKKGKSPGEVAQILSAYWTPILNKCRAAIKEIVATTAYLKKKTNNPPTLKYLADIVKAASELLRFELEQFTPDSNSVTGQARAQTQGSNEEVLKQRNLLKSAFLRTKILNPNSTNAEIKTVIDAIEHSLRDLAVSMGNAIKRPGPAPFDKALVMKAAKCQPGIMASWNALLKAEQKYKSIKSTLLSNIETEISELLGELDHLR